MSQSTTNSTTCVCTDASSRSLCRVRQLTETDCLPNQALGVLTHVRGPPFDVLEEPLQVTAIQRAASFLEPRKVSSHDPKEARHGVPCARSPVFGPISLARLIDEAPQRGGRPAVLRRKPIPVAGKQRHFSRNHAESGSPGTSHRRPGSRHQRAEYWVPGESSNCVVRAATQVEVDLLTGEVVEQEHRLALVRFFLGPANSGLERS